MKKLITILILSLPVTLLAQDMIIIPKGTDTLYRVLVTPWYGIDPIETKDGNFIIPAKVLDDLIKFNVKLKVPTKISLTDKVLSVELTKLPIKDVKLIELKEPELIEPIIKEPIKIK